MLPFRRFAMGASMIALSSEHIPFGINGEVEIEAGTSASTPAFAAMIAAVNDARIAIGKSPVGWLNPAVRSCLPSVP